jgi:hypothetical protein
VKVLADIFPAHLAVVAPGVLEDVYDLNSNPPTAEAFYRDTTRIIVTDEAIFVAQDGPSGAQVIFQERYELFLKAADSKSDYRIITKSGKMLAFKKDTNCGCGSRLRGWNAYKTISSIKDSI